MEHEITQAAPGAIVEHTLDSELAEGLATFYNLVTTPTIRVLTGKYPLLALPFPSTGNEKWNSRISEAVAQDFMDAQKDPVVFVYVRFADGHLRAFFSVERINAWA